MNLKILSPQMIGSSLVLLLLVSCASPLTAPTPTPIPPTPTPTAPPQTPTRTPLPPPISPDFPTGDFYHKHPEGSYCVFRFSQDGSWAFYWLVPSLDLSTKQPYLTGTYSIAGNLYTETSITMPDCPPATYAWTYDGQILRFQLVGEDTCSGRQQTYESPLLYTRVK